MVISCILGSQVSTTHHHQEQYIQSQSHFHSNTMLCNGDQKHFVLVTFPGQGHINPAVEFAKRLIRTGVRVTFVTSLCAHRRMLSNSTSPPEGLTFEPFSDGYDEGFKSGDDVNHYMSEISRRGSEALSELVERYEVSCLICSLLLPWASKVAHKHKVPSALLWIQPAAVFDIYYYYFSGYRDLIINNIDDPSYAVKLPGLPLLKSPDLPSFFLPSNPYSFGIELFQEQFELLSQESESFRVLVNTFDELEPEALKAVPKFNLVGIGPLVPPAFIEDMPKETSDDSFVGDLFDRSNDYIEWLQSRDKSSVVYVSFGSIAVLTNNQMEELARALVESRRPFLWIIRSSGEGVKQEQDEKYREILREANTGIVVPWCSQVEVLSHPSTGCFVTHCGWNSSLEAIAIGVPVVAFPQWTDQGTNAKLIEDVWKVGVRVRPSEEDKIVKCEEILRCLEEVMEGESGEELRSNARKWRSLAREAVKEGGSSDKNLRAFVEDVGANC